MQTLLGSNKNFIFLETEKNVGQIRIPFKLSIEDAKKDPNSSKDYLFITERDLKSAEFESVRESYGSEMEKTKVKLIKMSEDKIVLG